MMGNDTVITSLKQKIDDLNQQAWEARVNDSPKAFELSQQSVELARTINYTKGLAAGLRSLGFGYVRLFKNDEAAPLLRESLSLFQSLNDLKGQAIVYEYLGIIERNWGNLGHSLELLLKGYDLIQQVESSEEIETTSCYQIGVTYKHLGDHENALDYLYRSLSIAEKTNFSLMEAYATNIIGSIYFDNGEYKRALECYQQSLVVRQESHDKWGEAGSLDNIGFTYLKLNDLDKAIDYCKRSLAISQSTDDKKGEANALLHLAEIYEKAGDVKQASEFSNQSLEIRKARGDRRGEAEVLLFLADLYKKRNGARDPRIFEWLDSGLKIAEEIKAQDLLSKAYYSLHEHYIQQENHKASLVNLQAHLQIEKELHKNAINQKVSNLEISHKAEAISQRNKELTELNEQIEKANAELRIESSLERVRTAAMAMNKPDDMLEICKIISLELASLGVKEIRNVQTAIFYEAKGFYMNYEYYAKQDQTSITETDYNNHPVAKEFASKMLNGSNEVFTHGFQGQEVKDWLEYQKKTNVFIDTFLETARSLNYYYYSLGPVAMGISTYESLSEADIELFKRFRNVFELAYRRYLDIEKAQLQAREAQIEAALERVRAKSMAMHHSDDLISVINIVKEQLIQLGFHFHGANFVTDYSDAGYTMWLASPNESFPTKIYVPQIQQKLFKGVAEAVEKGLDFTTYTLSFEEKNLYFKNLFENSLAATTSEKSKQFIFESKGMAASVVLLSKIRLNLMNVDLIPYTDEENSILKRIAYVFEQSYIRFLDLKKAEAQAREAQIETALERIRARAMAMHSSDELIEVSNILREQMGLLGQPELETSVVSLYDGDSGMIHNWNAFRQPGLSSGAIITSTSSFPGNSSELTREMVAMYRAGKKEFTLTAAGQKLIEFFQVLIKSDPLVADYAGMYVPDQAFYHFTTFTGGTILTVSYEPPSEDTKLLQRKAASVFDMAYRRYLDLKKAEAQAREAQIQLALERVRARTMAMHNSHELADVIKLIYQEFDKLKINNESTDIEIGLINEETGVASVWAHFYLSDGSISTFAFPIAQFEGTRDEFSKWKATPIEKRNELFFTTEFTSERLEKMMQVTDQWPELAEIFQPLIEAKITKWVTHNAYFSHGILTLQGVEPYSQETQEIQRRFAKVFEQTYTRFLDLKKAEAQAREAQIEAALERVRSRSMAMHKSDELLEVVASVFQQMQLLGFNLNLCNIVLFDNKTLDADYWASASQQAVLPESYHIPYSDHPLYQYQVNAWRNAESFAIFELSGETKKSWDEILFTKTGLKRLPDSTKKMMQQLDKVFLSSVATKHGLVQAIGTEKLSKDDASILTRFAKVFEQTYTRFLDLQKAEAQAREAQIEAALERVRSRSMAMHKSDELREVVAVLFTQLQHIGVDINFCSIAQIDKVNSTVEFWLSGFSQEILPESYHVPNIDHPFYQNFQKTFRSGTQYAVFDLAGEEKRSYDKLWFTLTDFKNLPGPVKKPMMEMDRVVLSCAFTKNGMIQIGGFAPLPDTKALIVQRFAKVFEQTYTRFLDLQKAEGQAREAQIETGLERVRSKTMAMHRSEEVTGIAVLLNEELLKLGFEGGSTIIIIDKKTGDTEQWTGFSENKSLKSCYVPHFNHPYANAVLDAWKTGEKSLVYTVAGDEKRSLDEHYFSTGYKDFPENDKKWMRAMESVTFSHAFMKYGAIHWGPGHLTEEQLRILQRFSKVFEQSYTRFLDLKKAEAQAREAQIEAALERVRARAMAMHKSDDLQGAVTIMFEEFQKLNLDVLRCGVGMLDKDSKTGTVWATSLSDNGIAVQLSANESFDTTPLMRMIYDHWKKQEDLAYILQGQELIDYYKIMDESQLKLPRSQVQKSKDQFKPQWYYGTMFAAGGLYAFRDKPFAADDIKIMKRFASVVDLTYKRFLDLQKAEAQAREALIEAALERVRARALAMQEPEELKDVAQVLRNEMGALGVEELETSSIYIHGDNSDNVECWYALQDSRHTEKKMVSDHFVLNLDETWVGRQMKEFYSSGEKQTSIVMQGTNRKEWIEYCYKHSPAFSGFYGETIPDRTYHLYKFSHGYIGAAAPGDISGESWKLLSRAASVFSLAYSRFKDLTQARNDLIQLKEEKKRAEDALSELQSAQKQLIQTEKMASLGELTAGIAHEIQNPLNFVNNFSDVSNELIEEMKEELATGNMQQAIQIANDVKDNLEKILHHGKRADGIVKGMLQHSRISSGVKEPTDINSLADEYLRLAYHGFRAKDKSFSAKFETDFDHTIEKINVIPQDIGRVILNLINNAFYAVNEKKKQTANGYDPIVTIRTKKLDDKIEISVKDNGKGIPQKMLDKIFQPFFTTKPTGQGTGLGLSLTYDIVTKVHAGEISVRTSEGNGTEFIVHLPVN